MPRAKSPKVINNEVKPSFSTEALDKALRNIEELMDKCVLGSNYILLRDTAQAIWEKRGLSGDGIYVGLPKRYMTPESISTIETELAKEGVKVGPEGFDYFVDQVPVHLKLIQRKYGFFEHLDQVLYNYGDYQMPNPFELYWKSRFLVQ